MLIPVRCRNKAAADRDKNDEAWQNYNNMGCPGRNHRACAGWLWRQLDRAGQQGQRSAIEHLPHAVLGKLALAVLESNPAAKSTARADSCHHHDGKLARRNGRECIRGDSGGQRRNLTL